MAVNAMLASERHLFEGHELARRAGGPRIFAVPAARLPPPVQKLAKREREVAALVYEHGPISANEVLAGLSSPLTNGAVRSMLNRLVAKGILARRLAGVGKTFVYLPAITTDAAIECGFRRFAEDFFGGSTDRALRTMNVMLSGR